MRKLLFSVAATRQLAELPDADREAVFAALQILAGVGLASDSAVDVAPLRNRAGHRVRVGAYRAIVEVTRSHVQVGRIGHRLTVYRP